MNKENENTIHQARAATEVLSYKWHAVIIEIVNSLNEARYSDIDSEIDQISSKMLSDGLSDLVERNILTKVEKPSKNGGVTYELTMKGKSFASLVQAFIKWDTIYNEQNPSVLIVEDDPIASSVLSDYLSDSFKLRSVSRGEDVIQYYSKDTDIVILDRKLEDTNGGRVAMRIKQKDPQALILVVSGVDPENDILDLPIDDYLKKPGNRAELRDRISDVLARQDFEVDERKYLALRSKKLALIEAHGASALGLQSYNEVETRINNVNMPEERTQLLEEFLTEDRGN